MVVVLVVVDVFVVVLVVVFVVFFVAYFMVAVGLAFVRILLVVVGVIVVGVVLVVVVINIYLEQSNMIQCSKVFTSFSHKGQSQTDIISQSPFKVLVIFVAFRISVKSG